MPGYHNTDFLPQYRHTNILSPYQHTTIPPCQHPYTYQLLATGKENSNSSTNGNSRNSEGSGSGGGGGGGGGRSRGHKEQKTTRVRTVLNEKQLHTLRTCYGANPRPDALMKEQLVEMTGLSPRVIRVWFQNKRCKDKKRSIMMKQLQQQQQEKVNIAVVII